METNYFYVSIDGLEENVYDINVEISPNSFEVNVIKEEKNYEIHFDTSNFSSTVSSDDGNRISRTVDGGLYVPEIEIDLVSIYEDAKL